MSTGRARSPSSRRYNQIMFQAGYADARRLGTRGCSTKVRGTPASDLAKVMDPRMLAKNATSSGLVIAASAGRCHLVRGSWGASLSPYFEHMTAPRRTAIKTTGPLHAPSRRDRTCFGPRPVQPSASWRTRPRRRAAACRGTPERSAEVLHEAFACGRVGVTTICVGMGTRAHTMLRVTVVPAS